MEERGEPHRLREDLLPFSLHREEKVLEFALGGAEEGGGCEVTDSAFQGTYVHYNVRATLALEFPAALPAVAVGSLTLGTGGEALSSSRASLTVHLQEAHFPVNGRSQLPVKKLHPRRLLLRCQCFVWHQSLVRDHSSWPDDL